MSITLSADEIEPQPLGATPSGSGSTFQPPAGASTSIPSASLTEEDRRALADAAGLPASIAAHPGVKDAMRRAYTFGYGSGQLAEMAAKQGCAA